MSKWESFKNLFYPVVNYAIFFFSMHEIYVGKHVVFYTILVIMSLGASTMNVIASAFAPTDEDL